MVYIWNYHFAYIDLIMCAIWLFLQENYQIKKINKPQPQNNNKYSSVTNDLGRRGNIIKMEAFSL